MYVPLYCVRYCNGSLIIKFIKSIQNLIINDGNTILRAYGYQLLLRKKTRVNIETVFVIDIKNIIVSI